MSTTLKYWDDTAGEWVPFSNDASAYSSIKVKEVPTGTINGTNTTFTTSQAYIVGTLQVYINGLAQSSFITETTPGSGIFDLDEAPETGDTIGAYYHIAGTPLGNTDSWNNYSMTGFLEALYPVGAIYTSGSSTMPAIVAGVGTWARVEGKFIVGASDSDGDFDYGDTGGAKTHEHSLEGGYADVANIGSYVHAARVTAAVTKNLNHRQTVSGATFADQNTTSRTSLSGDSAAASGLPPYEAIYMWKRTA